VKPHETQRVPRLRIARTAPHRLLQARAGVVHLAPTSAAQSALARAVGGPRRDPRRLVVFGERVFVLMRKLEGVAELDVRHWIIGRRSNLELRHLGPCRYQVSAEGEHPHEQTPRCGVRRPGAEPLAKQRGRLHVSVLTYQRLRPLGGGRKRARSAKDEEGRERGRVMPNHRGVWEIEIMAQLDEIKTIGILGAGQMGTGIAQVAASSGLSVVLADASREFADRGKKKIATALSKQVERQKTTVDASAALLARIAPAAGPDDFRECDLVIEAATEKVDLKLALFRKCDAVLPQGKWLASNTSSISLTRLAAATSRPDRVVGMHFMNPPPLMKLVEIVRAVQTSDETYALIRALAEKMGKTTITSRDAPGFLVNRILIPMLCEACFALAEGVGTPEDIDSGAKVGLNHPMGPLELSDLIGLDTVLAIADVLLHEMGDDKYRAPTLLRNLVAAGYYGKKSGRGFYLYDEKGSRLSAAPRGA
jgi:3-hydroxybutyryl-CoA dehydrogenase